MHKNRLKIVFFTLVTYQESLPQLHLKSWVYLSTFEKGHDWRSFYNFLADYYLAVFHYAPQTFLTHDLLLLGWYIINVD